MDKDNLSLVFRVFVFIICFSVVIGLGSLLFSYLDNIIPQAYSSFGAVLVGLLVGVSIGELIRKLKLKK